MVYRFFILDDEYYIRQRIRLCIPWEAYGYEYAGEASSVPKGLEFIQENRLDLAIVDISMPGQSGLEFIRCAREIQPSMKFIILSGFAAFEYARESLQYGVSRYLLKPVNPEELADCITQLKKEMDEEHARRLERQQLLQRNQLAEKELESIFFRNIFSNKLPPEESFQLEQAGIVRDRQYLLFVIDVVSESAGRTYDQKAAARQAVANTLETHFSRRACCLLAHDMYDHVVLLLDKEQPEPSSEKLLEEIYQPTRILQIEAICGYCIVPEGTVLQLHRSYQQALDFFLFRAIYGNSVAVLKESLPSSQILNHLHESRNQLRYYLFAGNYDLTMESLRSIFHIIEQEKVSLTTLETILFTLFNIAVYYAASNQLELFDGSQKWASQNCSDLVKTGKSLWEIFHSFQLLFSTLLQSRGTNGVQKVIEEVVEQAKTYIQQNYKNKNLGLTEIASNFLISASYLSRNFKKICGISLTGYITQCRLECACQLLESTALSVAEISEKSGYQDLFYFSKKFKAAYGVSPSHYRAKVQEKE